MKWKYILATVFALGVGFFLIAALRSSVTSVMRSRIHPNGMLSLVVEPDDGIAPVLDMIAGASASVDLVMYELDDMQIESALVAAQKRGVDVRVILSGGYKGATSTTNAAAYDLLAANGVPVRWSPAYFSLTHEKSLVVDGNRALIMTFNLVSKYYATGRDFGIIDGDMRDVAAMEDTFDDDWSGGGIAQGVVVDSEKASFGGNDGDGGDDLLWSPDSEGTLVGLIDGATKSLFIYNEEMADMDVTKALIDDATRGVAVYVDMTGAAEWKWEFKELTTAGVHVRTYADEDDAPLYIHAKMIIADGARAFVGSENFSAASLDENRELGVMISDRKVIASLMKTFAVDWRNAAPIAP